MAWAIVVVVVVMIDCMMSLYFWSMLFSIGVRSAVVMIWLLSLIKSSSCEIGLDNISLVYSSSSSRSVIVW